MENTWLAWSFPMSACCSGPKRSVEAAAVIPCSAEGLKPGDEGTQRGWPQALLFARAKERKVRLVIKAIRAELSQDFVSSLVDIWDS